MFSEIKKRLEDKSIFFAAEEIQGKPAVIGYDKKFKWSWMGTQLNTFVVAADYENEVITVPVIEKILEESFKYAQKNYNGWPRGLQSGLGVIVILLSSQISEDAITYCKQLKSGKKWAGFSIPVTLDSSTKKVYFFAKNPIWGKIYYPYFRKLIGEVTQ